LSGEVVIVESTAERLGPFETESEAIAGGVPPEVFGEHVIGKPGPV